MNRNAVRRGALALGIVLFAGALYYIHLNLEPGAVRRLGVGLPLALVFSGLWHLARTWAWAWCFPVPRKVPFLRLLRVRLSAEAFSYLTLRGIAGEPLKVVLLADRVTAREGTTAVALERLAYLIGTTIIVGVASAAALAWLPLTAAWFRVFRAFVIVAAAIAVISGLVITGRGRYLQSMLRTIDGRLGTRVSEGIVGRFATAVEAQMLDLVRGNPRRLLVLLTATVLAYLCMVLEAWAILRASGAVVGPDGALAVETFSRVASFASSFIPANLGALEASSLAAASAIGAVAGGAALALARRIRGLFWAGVGLAIYPRGRRPQSRDALAAAALAGSEPRRDAPPALAPSAADAGGAMAYLPHASWNDVVPTLRLAGLPIVERVIRSAVRAGYRHVIVSTWDVPVETLACVRRLASALPGIVLASSDDDWRAAVGRLPSRSTITVVGPGTVVSPALLTSARRVEPEPGTAADVPAGGDWPATGVLRIRAEAALDRAAVARTLRERLERRVPLPTGEDVAEGRADLALRISTRDDLRHAEAAIRRSSYKGTDNTLARFNRRVSLPISVALMRTPLTANQLSATLVALGLYSAWLFSLGQYRPGVLAAFLSLAASILDGCDGEIARLKYQESALGCWIETVGDYTYYVAIFVGLTVGAVRATDVEAFYWVGGLALAGTLLTFALLIYLRTRITAGRPERLHAIAAERFQAEPTLWSKIAWRLSFTATRSAMPYGIFAFSLLDALPAIVVLAAVGANVYWISLAVKLKTLMGTEDAVSVGAGL